ncbi:MAG: tRNA (N6-threonylcarbamoyladenosine(37)-N6)-methyltransferase TrmO [Lentisphaeria bacterium]|nr:tRNA (N6-threonylcarbamoyladenosine(37)-N6)-methyltransferase TrmO [Lentisphaeria bacterium]
MEEKFEFRQIGVVHSRQQYRFEAPRQGVFASGDGEIEIFSEYAGDAIADLAGFDRIWVIFCFHLNSAQTWKPKVRPPFPSSGPCRSLFATRSPYRVNPIGLSCVELAGISGRKLLVRHIDMLDGTPVLDIKPYIPEADAFPESAVGWRCAVPEAEELQWDLELSEKFERQAALIYRLSGLDLVNMVKIQLGNEPLDSSRKRVKMAEDGSWMLGCRTWRISFTAEPEKRQVRVMEVFSNYLPEELAEGADDRYKDKDVHRKFLRQTIQQ